MLNRLMLLMAITILPCAVNAQSDIDAELAAFEASLDNLDSASLIVLLDSLIQQSGTPLKSQLGISVGYNSQLVDAGRDLGLNQSGFSFGASYYHKSGAFIGMSGYTNSVSSPTYYLNLFSAGYIGSITSSWGFSISYDHYFYNNSSNGEQNNQIYSDGLSASLYSLGRNIDTGFYYSAILGDTITAHRITWSVRGNIAFKNFLIFDKVTIAPTANMLLGNSTSYLFNITRSESDLTLAQRRRLLNDDDPTNDPPFFDIEEEFPNTFGLLSYSLALPIVFRKDNLMFLASYTYSIPVELPGQSEDLQNRSFISLSASYFFQL